jgi:hypothetical protein
LSAHNELGPNDTRPGWWTALGTWIKPWRVAAQSTDGVARPAPAPTAPAATISPAAPGTDEPDASEQQLNQVRQLVKHALESPTPEEFAGFFDFAKSFRRLAVWNARMAYIQRPGARIIASEYEWTKVGRHVQPDAVPIIILWPFSPIRYVYELADTGPLIDREAIKDPFSATGEFGPAALTKLDANLKKQKSFRVTIEPRDRASSRLFPHSLPAPLTSIRSEYSRRRMRGATLIASKERCPFFG